ncbi:MAG: SDR family oxidoreductase [Armatimonadetes bacterium]|nr:SDR family oxidoreductase [Armatimonadota bacterium]
MIEKGFAGKVVMVTGGATGIGAACVERFASLGASVACCYNKSAESANVLAEKLSQKGTPIHTVKVNVSSSSEVQDAVTQVSKHFGTHISVLVNNAGDQIRTMPIEDMDEDLWDLVLAVNLKGAFLCSKYCIPSMKSSGWGRIINMSSISARSGGGPGAAHYAASKAGLESFTRSLAKELGPFGITANSISPGVVFTPIHERHNTPENIEKLRQMIPALRLGEPSEVAGAVAFLASEDASYINGVVLPVNGGMRLD